MCTFFRTTEMSDRVYSSRRGVTLFIVLALMTMFALLVTAFMVITTQARRQAEHAAKALIEPGNGGGGYATFASNFDKALEKLLIGDNLETVLGPHSILENQYGHPVRNTTDPLTAYFGTTTQVTAPVDSLGNPIGILRDTSSIFTTLLPLSGSIPPYFRSDLIGCVLTMTEGNLQGYSTFIVSYDNSNIELAPFTNVPSAYSTLAVQATEIAGKNFIINSPAFSGTGPGFVSTAGVGVAALSGDDDDSIPYALRPNVLAPTPGATPTQDYKDYLKTDLVLMNPDYTAPDYLNMFLAWNNVQNVGGTWTINNIIPSFHRPQLVTYWESDITNWNDLRKIVLRPLSGDHPNFSGSNPVAATTTLSDFITFLKNGPWDVDNDGDGVADGIWVDVGLGTTTINGVLYKKLVSYYVLDMDGRLNVNAHGNVEHLATTFDDELRGSGSGPAEVRLDLALNTIIVNQLLKGKDTDNDGRYGKFGTDDIPGVTSNTETTAASQMFQKSGILPEAYGHPTITTGVGGIIPDWWGNFDITSFDTLGNRLFSATDIYAENPYLMNPYLTNSGDDSPFTSSDLQYLLRSVGDIDYSALPKRLRNLFDAGSGTDIDQYNLSPYRLFLGTRSSDIPVFSRFGGTASTGTSLGLYNYICNNIFATDTTKTEDLFNLLPEEIRRGEKINLNRLTFRDDWIPQATDTPAIIEARLKAKAKFAQEIFYLLFVLSYDQLYSAPNCTGTMTYSEGSLTRDQVITRLAQWSVNLVDFIDPDATMTPFIFNTAPFSTSLPSIPYDNATDINDLLTTTDPDWTLTTTDTKLIWGFEKPEVALTETYAVHNRRTEDSDKETDGGIPDENCPICGVNKKYTKFKKDSSTACTGTHDDDFDQVDLPEGALFVELYRQGNDNRNYPVGDLVDDTTKELDLGKIVSGDYVWRLVIGEKTNAKVDTTSTDTKDMLYQSTQTSSPSYSFQTKQWKGTSTGDTNFCDTLVIPDRIIWFGTNKPTGTNIPTDVDVDTYSLYSSGSSNFKLLMDNYIVLAPPASEMTSLTSVTPSVATPIEYNGLNISFPSSGYGSVSLPKNTPLNQETTDTDHELYADGTISCYKTICLQRLADPTRSHHPVTNPYVTVDWNMIDLHVINTAGDVDIEAKIPTPITKEPLVYGAGGSTLASRQWGIDSTLDTQLCLNLWSRSVTGTILAANNPTFGNKNASKDLLHFPWHDAPFANSYELMLVPVSTAGRFGVEFYDNGTTDWVGTSGTNSLGTGLSFSNPNGNLGSYLNFFGGDLNLSRLFDYVRVPSKFGGTIRRDWITDASGIPIKPIYEMREPGKINLNTATEPAWEALKGSAARTKWHGYKDANGLYDLRHKKATDDGYPSEFAPFRSPQATALVPPLTTTAFSSNKDILAQDTPANTTLLRTNLLEPETDADNPYTLLESYMRLSDMTTTRSNVFAVWMTIGYFEVVNTHTPDGVYPDGYELGAEKGLDNGTVKRHRAFYLIDRSTPVGFRRGTVYQQENGDPHYKPVIVDSKILE